MKVIITYFTLLVHTWHSTDKNVAKINKTRYILNLTALFAKEMITDET